MKTILIGQRFGKLVAVEDAGFRVGKKNGRRAYRWLCRCDCGMTKAVDKNNLLRGNSTSCGCVQKLNLRLSRTTHGETAGDNTNGTPEWRTWRKIFERCYDTSGKDYSEYGGRGIRICRRWKLFANFLTDMGRRPTPTHSIDRYPNNNGSYSPSNCRWATKSEQARNRRPQRPYTRGGVLISPRKARLV
jgi:hypothetical protein